MARSARQMKILELISKQDIDRQDDLAKLLRESGFQVTQATVSRDIRDMGIIKVLASDGKGYKYTPQQVREERSFDKYRKLFKNAVLSIDSSENIIVIQTESGGASSAAALLDRLAFEEVLGTVSGDDTIMIVVSSKDKTEMVVEKFRKLLD